MELLELLELWKPLGLLKLLELQVKVYSIIFLQKLLLLLLSYHLREEPLVFSKKNFDDKLLTSINISFTSCSNNEVIYSRIIV